MSLLSCFSYSWFHRYLTINSNSGVPLKWNLMEGMGIHRMIARDQHRKDEGAAK